MYSDVKYGSLPASKIIINEKEFERRIGGKCSVDSKDVLNFRKTFDACLNCKFAYVGMDLSFPQEGICNFGFVQINSNDLYKNLKDCKKAYMMAVTLGIGVDRLLSRLKVKSAGEHFITNAVASAAAESLCDFVEMKIKSEENLLPGVIWRPRYSPGYGDCSIENQKLLLNRLNAERCLGIILNDSYFMTPTKSITAIMGMKYEENN